MEPKFSRLDRQRCGGLRPCALRQVPDRSPFRLWQGIPDRLQSKVIAELLTSCVNREKLRQPTRSWNHLRKVADIFQGRRLREASMPQFFCLSCNSHTEHWSMLQAARIARRNRGIGDGELGTDY